MVPFGVLLLLTGLWLAFIPIHEYQIAMRTGAHRIPFSRMLLRIIVAACVLAIGGMLAGSQSVLSGRGPVFQVEYLLTALLIAFVMLGAGVTDYMLVKREMLLGQREILRSVLRSREPEE